MPSKVLSVHGLLPQRTPATPVASNLILRLHRHILTDYRLLCPDYGAHYPFLGIKWTEIFDDQPQHVQRLATELFIVDLRHLLRIFSFVLFYPSRWCYLLGTQPKEHPYIFVTKVL